MELIPYENSYMTLEEANGIISQLFLSSSKERVFWDTLSDDDKTVLILNATEKFDIPQMVYIGLKVSSTQNMEWPRLISGVNKECPNSIKRGLLKQMFMDYFDSQSDESKLIELGVKSFADGGGAKIEFANASDSLSTTLKNKIGISKKIWRTYFAEWSKIIG